MELTEFQRNVLESYRRTRACKIKVSFLTRTDAKKNAKKMTRKSETGRVRAYKCRYCDYYHIGHNKFAKAV